MIQRIEDWARSTRAYRLGLVQLSCSAFQNASCSASCTLFSFVLSINVRVAMFPLSHHQCSIQYPGSRVAHGANKRRSTPSVWLCRDPSKGLQSEKVKHFFLSIITLFQSLNDSDNKKWLDFSHLHISSFIVSSSSYEPVISTHF